MNANDKLTDRLMNIITKKEFDYGDKVIINSAGGSDEYINKIGIITDIKLIYLFFNSDIMYFLEFNNPGLGDHWFFEWNLSKI